ncbi:MAG: hypothetical protein R2751_13530 [Bacteroidales bacterium]
MAQILYPRNLRPLLFLLLMFGAGTGIRAQSAAPAKVLCIGSSYTNFNDLPGLLQGMADNRCGACLEVHERTHNGWFLADHAADETTRAVIRSEAWDVVILQGSSIHLAYPFYFPEPSVFDALEELKALILENRSQTRIVFFLPWAWEEGLTFASGRTEDYFRMQDRILSNSLRYASELDLILAPVGMAWTRILQDPDLPEHYLHDPDLHHPNLRGSYLAACVLFSTLTGESTEGSPFPASLTGEVARSLQEAGSNTVRENPEIWRIPEAGPLASENPGTRAYSGADFIVGPNPFRNNVRIQFRAGAGVLCRLELSTLLGQTVCVEERTGRGSEWLEVEFAPETRACGGMYLCTLVRGSHRIARSLVQLK